MCGQQFLYQRTEQHARIIQLRCRSWRCSKCAPRRVKRLKAEAISGHPKTFITLTVNPHLHQSPGDAARAITRGWRAMRRVIEAKLPGVKGQYLTVMEATAKGWPHLHVLTTRSWIDQKWLSQQWEKITGARIVDIRRIKNARMAVSYVAKYLSKKPAQYENCKRYYFTQGYRPKRERKWQHLDWSTASNETLNGEGHVLAAALLANRYQLLEGGPEFWLMQCPADCVSTLAPPVPP